jgi:predicted CXXCH cytochrome family protein
MWGGALLLILSPLLGGAADHSGYLGREVCAGCHRSIAATQVKTNMARTWQGTGPNAQLPASYSETIAEGPAPDIEYSLKRVGDKLEYRVQMPGRPAQEFPIESVVGGTRHGLSFLLRVPAIEGSPLPVARLIEARYFHSAGQDRLAFSLGFPVDKPTTYETAFGRVLTPYLERRCLSCHVAPRTHGGHVETGVSCENCHGPGQPHLAALSNHSLNHGILNPGKLPVSERMRPCSQCHAGSSLVEDPMPDDLLISDQVTALKNSECWKESNGGLACTNCHNPHQDAPRAVLVVRAEKTCLGCHTASIKNHAGLCPVNRVSGCVTCHMANEIRGAFTIAEHWIRVHPEQNVKVPAPNPAWRTTITPNHLWLRMIVVDSSSRASELRQQLLSGGSFFDLARTNSMDRASAVNGGFLGDLNAGELDPAWSAAALKLEPGEFSEVLPANGKYVLLQRMPRTFRVDAEDVFNKALELRRQGGQQEFVNELLASLKIYPRLLRALTWLGAAYGEAGNPNVSAGILSMATRLYPQDAGAHFNLGMAYGAMGNAGEEIAEYKRTIEIDPDYVPAYLNWGGALYAKGQIGEAIELYRKGLNVNPLNASLHYSLSVALDRQGKRQEADTEMTLAAKIDPKYARH